MAILFFIALASVSIEVGHSMQKLFSHIISGVLFGFFFVGSLDAQDSSRDTLSLALPEVQVFGKSQILQHVFNSHRVQLLSSTDFRESNSKDLGQILENHSGAFIKRYGPGLSSFSFRGLSSSQSVLALDGIPLSSPQLGSFDLSIIPSLALETVELAYGGASSFAGSSGMSGMVNMTTAPQNHKSSYLIKSGLGQFGELESGLSLTHWLGQNTWVKFSGEINRNESDYGVLDRNLLEPKRVMQRGWDSQSRMALLGVGHKMGLHKIKINWWGLDGERGLGFAEGEERGARQWDQSQRIWMSDEIESTVGAIRAHVLFQNENLRYARPFPYSDSESDVIDDTGKTKLWRSELSWQSSWDSPLDLSTSIFASRSEAVHPSLAENPTQENIGISIRSEWLSPSGQWNSGLRLDRQDQGSQSSIQLLPSLGFKIPLEKFFVKANASRVYRTPTLNDLYWQPGGNLELLPESGFASDLGIAYRDTKYDWFISSEATAFLQQVRNQIVWQDEGSYWSPSNIGRVRSRGIEWSLYGSRILGLFRGFSIFANYTVAKDRSLDGSASFDKQLRYTPKVQIKANTRFRKKNWSGAINVLSTSKRFITSDETQYLEAYFLLGGKVSYTQRAFGMDGKLSLSIENGLDRDYEIISSYGMPPRTLKIEILLQNRN